MGFMSAWNGDQIAPTSINAPAVTGPGARFNKPEATGGALSNPIYQLLQKYGIGQNGKMGPIDLSRGQDGNWSVNGQGGFNWGDLVQNLQGAMGRGGGAEGAVTPTSAQNAAGGAFAENAARTAGGYPGTGAPNFQGGVTGSDQAFHSGTEPRKPMPPLGGGGPGFGGGPDVRGPGYGGGPMFQGGYSVPGFAGGQYGPDPTTGQWGRLPDGGGGTLEGGTPQQAGAPMTGQAPWMKYGGVTGGKGGFNIGDIGGGSNGQFDPNNPIDVGFQNGSIMTPGSTPPWILNQPGYSGPQ